MTRNDFYALFHDRAPVVFPVIHVLDDEQTLGNIRIARNSGASGVFLINHDFGVDAFLPIIRRVRRECPNLWLGVNFLAVTGLDAFPVLGELHREGIGVDAYWADDARIDEHQSTAVQPEARAIADAKRRSGWEGIYFGGTAFKKQRGVDADNYAAAAGVASDWMDVVTTSGPATGLAADTSKIDAFRRGCGDSPLALASGVTCDNIIEYADDVDAILVATGINRNDDFYHIDPSRLSRLLDLCGESKKR